MDAELQAVKNAANKLEEVSVKAKTELEDAIKNLKVASDTLHSAIDDAFTTMVKQVQSNIPNPPGASK